MGLSVEVYAGPKGTSGKAPLLFYWHGTGGQGRDAQGPVSSKDFATASLAKGGFVVDCEHGAGHCGAPPDLQVAAWQFMKDHPYGVSAEPYAKGLPSSFPSYCKIVPK